MSSGEHPVPPATDPARDATPADGTAIGPVIERSFVVGNAAHESTHKDTVQMKPMTRSPRATVPPRQHAHIPDELESIAAHVKRSPPIGRGTGPAFVIRPPDAHAIGRGTGPLASLDDEPTEIGATPVVAFDLSEVDE